MIETDSGCKVVEPFSSVVAAEVRVRRVPVPPAVIVVAIRWYLRFNLSYGDVEELLVERGIEVDHATVYRWVQRFALLLAGAARFACHCPGDRWYVDETYVGSTASGGTPGTPS